MIITVKNIENVVSNITNGPTGANGMRDAILAPVKNVTPILANITIRVPAIDVIFVPVGNVILVPVKDMISVLVGNVIPVPAKESLVPAKESAERMIISTRICTLTGRLEKNVADPNTVAVRTFATMESSFPNATD